MAKMNYNDRIKLNVPLSKLSKEVCKLYQIGTFKSNKLIKVGYEDYTYILSTSIKKYIVKVLSLSRTDNEAQDTVTRASVPYENGVACPKIYKINNINMSTIILNNVKYRLFLSDYINGKSFYELHKEPTIEELEYIASQTAKLHSIKYKPPFLYDGWAIINFKNEYEKYASLCSNEDKKMIDASYKLFKSCNMSKLPKAYVHGDIFQANVMKDKNDKIFFIDFSASNYSPRICDLAVSICDLCMIVNDIQLSKKRIHAYLKSYTKTVVLSAYEIQCLKIFLTCHVSLAIIATTKEKLLSHNNSKENTKILRESEKCLHVILDNNLL